MVGLSGIVGEHAGSYDVRTLPPTIAGDELTGTYRDEALTIRGAFHEGSTVSQPAESATGTLAWVWGEVYSHTDRSGNRRRVDPRDTARVCAEAYTQRGPEFVSCLDGEFAGCVYDRRTGKLHLFVDRLGARPLYYTETEEGLAFSTSIQTVPAIGGGERFDRPYLAEYLYSRRAFGTKTPIEGIEQLGPATIHTYDLGSGTIGTERYWEPVFRPIDKPLSWFTRELASRLERAVADRTPAGREHGLLLSGGSDARAVLAASETPLASYHMGDGWNREARITKRSADAAGAPFEALYRGSDYHATLLERAGPIMDFLGPFDTAHTLGFAEELSDLDSVLTGLFGDTLFGAWSLPYSELPLPFGGRLALPVAELPTTIDEYVSMQAAAAPTRDPTYLDAPAFEDVLRANIERRDGGVIHHGVPYRSIEQLVMSELYYPVTNGIGFDLLGTLQILPTRNPFLDRRLIDLHLAMPLRHRLCHEPVHRAIARLDPDLAAIPHAATRVPVKWPWAAHLAGEIGTDLLGKFDREHSYRTEGPWQNVHELIRETDFVERALDANADLIERLPFLDARRIEETYNQHLAGERNGQELYRLLTVLEMPLTRRITNAETNPP